jgi:class 3 adenylate cyclase
MEERGKTIMCCVLFLDIVGYSKQSVSREIFLKGRFNAYLSSAIRDIPLDDRIILDTGDGAALSFLGDIEDALKVALSMREFLHREGASVEPPLLVRMGINLGPVRFAKDINGQPIIVGDGINVAQRVMCFSIPGQILVARSYYEAVSRVSPDYAKMFFYQGSRTDKHVREHEIYATGFLGEFITEPQSIGGALQIPGKLDTVLEYLKVLLQTTSQRLEVRVKTASNAFRAASPRKKAAYLSALVVPLLVVALLAGGLVQHGPAPSLQVVEQSAIPQQARPIEPASTGQPAPPPAEVKKKAKANGSNMKIKEKRVRKNIEHKQNKVKPPREKSKHAAEKPKVAKQGDGKTGFFGMLNAGKGAPGFLSVNCMGEISVFVDGFEKVTIAKAPLRIRLEPGKHQVAIIHTISSTVYSETVTIKSGETFRIKSSFCK